MHYAWNNLCVEPDLTSPKCQKKYFLLQNYYKETVLKQCKCFKRCFQQIPGNLYIKWFMVLTHAKQLKNILVNYPELNL